MRDEHHADLVERQVQAQAERIRHLRALLERQDDVWEQLPALIASRSGHDRANASKCLKALHEAALSEGCIEAFEARLAVARAATTKQANFWIVWRP